jgi:putative endonuclease
MSRFTGNQFEKLALQYLKKQGLKLRMRNFTILGGEVDLIMQQGNRVIFVEVKYRKNLRFGTPLEAVTYTKQQRILRAATRYLQQEKLYGKADVRFDIVGITGDVPYKLEWVPNAFGG